VNKYKRQPISAGAYIYYMIVSWHWLPVIGSRHLLVQFHQIVYIPAYVTGDEVAVLLAEVDVQTALGEG